MADGKYSIDDILNEYSGTTTGGGSSDIDVDAIIGGFDAKPEPDLHITEPEMVKPAAEASDSFEEKYAKFASAVTAVKEREATVSPVPVTEKPARSFSQKMEQGGSQEVVRTEEKQEEKKSPLASIFGKKASSEEAKPIDEAPIQSISTERKVQENPFEKYSSIEETEAQREKQDLDEILN